MHGRRHVHGLIRVSWTYGSQLRDDVLAEDVDERRLIRADVVDPDPVEADLDQLSQARQMPAGIAGHDDPPGHVLGA